MSAYICSEKLINTLTSYYMQNCRNLVVGSTVYRLTGNYVVEILSRENFKGVNYLNKKDGIFPSYSFTEIMLENSAIEIIKLCKGYEYQTISSPAYETSLAKIIINRIIEIAISKLDGYEAEAADWTI